MNLTEFKEHEKASSPHLLLIGNPVAQSLSPLMHNTAARYYGLELRYHAVQVNSAELGLLASYINHPLMKGMNVTIPYKRVLMDYADRLSSSCRQIGATNTIVKENGQVAAHNTDKFGFCKPLDTYAYEIEGTRAIVFGTGGAARAIVHGLRELGLEEIMVVSRNPEAARRDEWPRYARFISYDAWPEYIEETSLLVNATPLGMAPRESQSPVEGEDLPLLQDKICYDIVYKPINTKFLTDAEQAGARTIGGLEMLIQQGSKSFELWTGRPFPLDEVREAVAEQIKS